MYSGQTGALLYTLTGEAAGDNFGFSVSGAGDVNGDCVPDVLIGSPWDATEGRAYVFFCASSGGAGDGPRCPCDCHADSQCDGVCNVLDVVMSVGAAFRGSEIIPDSDCMMVRTDADCDNDTDVFDVVRFVNVAFRNQPVVSNFCDPNAL